MDKRTITFEYDKTYFSILERLAASVGYENVHDYLEILIAYHVFDRLEDISGLGNSREFEKHQELAALDIEDETSI